MNNSKIDSNKEIVNNNIPKKIYTINGQPIEFEWPFYYPLFPVGISPVYNKQMHDKCTQIFLENCNYNKASAFVKGEIGFWGAFTYSNCTDPHRLRVLVLLYHYLFCFDDHIEDCDGDYKQNGILGAKSWGDLMRGMDKLCGRTRVETYDWKPYVTGVIACFDSVMMTYSDVQKKRLTDLIKSYSMANITECEMFDGSVPPFNIEQIFESRMITIGVAFSAQLIEYASNIEVPEEDWNSKEFQDFNYLGIKSIALLNDLVSFRKEILECDGNLKTCSNIIAVYIVSEGLSLQSAVNKVYELLKSTDAKLFDLHKSIREKSGTDRDTIRFIDNFMGLMGGNWLYHLGMKRYHGGLKGLIPLSGKFVFNSYETTIIPNYDVNKYKHLEEFYIIKD